MEEYTCIVCPNSCRITVSETKQGLEIHGNQCVRGADFARKEHTEPMRMFTSTIQLEGGWLSAFACNNRWRSAQSEYSTVSDCGQKTCCPYAGTLRRCVGF